MSALARFFAQSAVSVSGSDREESTATIALQNQGIHVTIGHDARNIPAGCELVVYNAAIGDTNPEITEARRLSIPLMDRAALLGLAMQSYDCPICIAGTHGKTTTTSMLAEIFIDASANPTVMNGGILPKIGSTLHHGAPPYFIAESCEYHDSFLRLHPKIGIILNMDWDHSDYFKDYNHMFASFRRFAELVPDDGLLIVNNSLALVGDITDGLTCKIITIGHGADFDGVHPQVYGEMRSKFTLIGPGEFNGEVDMGVIGRHNMENALAAIAAASFCGLSFDDVKRGLAGFTGVNRRLQRLGEFKGAKVVDDYAHHPAEIAATLDAVKNLGYTRIIPIFQPHTHTRTKEFLEDFAASLAAADLPIILDIYSPAGREEPDCDIHSKDLADIIEKKGRKCAYFSTFDEAMEYLAQIVTHNDLLITMGAGDVFRLGQALVTP